MTKLLQAELLATPLDIHAWTMEVMGFLKSQSVDERAIQRIALAFEEIILNLGTHGGCTDKPAHIRVLVESDTVTGEITDDGPPFDPWHAPAPDLTLALEDRPIGGLGLFAVRQMCQATDYRRDGERNVTTFTVART